MKYLFLLLCLVCVGCVPYREYHYEECHPRRIIHGTPYRYHYYHDNGRVYYYYDPACNRWIYVQ